MARKKQVIKAVPSVTVFLVKAGKVESPLRPGQIREGDGFRDSLAIANENPAIDQNRIGMVWGVGIPKKVTLTVPGSDGQLIMANHALPEMEVEFKFKIGFPVAVHNVPQPIMDQLGVMEREGQIILVRGEMEIAGVEEVAEDAAEDTGDAPEGEEG